MIPAGPTFKSSPKKRREAPRFSDGEVSGANNECGGQHRTPGGGHSAIRGVCFGFQSRHNCKPPPLGVGYLTMERSFSVDDLIEDLTLGMRRRQEGVYRAVLDTRKQVYTTDELISFMHIFTPLTGAFAEAATYRIALVYEDMRPKYAQNAATFSSNALEAAKRLAQREQTSQNAALTAINSLLGGMSLYQALNAERLRRQHPIAQNASIRLHVDLDQALDWVRSTGESE